MYRLIGGAARRSGGGFPKGASPENPENRAAGRKKAGLISPRSLRSLRTFRIFRNAVAAGKTPGCGALAAGRAQ